jgi:hypothetical protein
MTNEFASLRINPFKDDIVREPRTVSFSVEGLNERPLNQLIAVFDQLTVGEPPRKPIAAKTAQLVVSPASGYGKSHLLGRLFQVLRDRATKIYLRPFQDPQRAWNSILLTTVQELDRPHEHDNQGRSQLEAFAMGVLAHVAADFMVDGGMEDYASFKPVVAYLRDHPLEVPGQEGPSSVLIDWLKLRLEDAADSAKLARLLRRRAIDLLGRERAWLKVLAGYAFAPSDNIDRDAALKWLRGEPLEVEEADVLKFLRADNDGSGDSSTREINSLSLDRLRDLCTLSSYFRPFIFCFDQTEFYGSDVDLVEALGACIWEFHASIPNQLTIVTANAADWTTDIRPKMRSAYVARLSSPIDLEGINLEQTKSLLAKRLADFQLSEAAISGFLNPNWIALQFSSFPELCVRDILSSARKRFIALAGSSSAPQSRTSIECLFEAEINKVRAKQALHQYSQDCLMWFAQVLIQGYDGVIVTKPKQRYFAIQWDWTGRSVYFAFEGGDHNARWRAIATEAVMLGNGSVKTIATIVFRTPDLKSIPRPSWGPAKKQIEEAARSGLQVIPLDLDEVCELHAAREFYSNALQGNVDYPPGEVLQWLKVRFEPWFKRFSHLKVDKSPPVEPRASNSGTSPAGIPPGELTQAELENVIIYVKNRKLVDIKEVLKKLGRETLKEAVLRAVEKSPNLKAHAGPQTIYLQWRISV